MTFGSAEISSSPIPSGEEGGALPAGENDGDILQWDVTGSVWEAVANTGGAGGSGASVVRFDFWTLPDSSGQGTWVVSEFPSVDYLFYSLRNTTTADGDNCTYKLDIPEGTYDVTLLHDTANGLGIVDITYNAISLFSSLDLYSSSTIRNVMSEATGKVITGTGLRDLVITINGKNASSSDYDTILKTLHFRRTS